GRLAPDLPQTGPRPAKPRPIVIIRAGGIVRTAHVPAYRRLDYPVAGIFDVSPEAAKQAAATFDIPCVYKSLEQAASVEGVVFDLAVPGDQIVGILEKLPDGSAILMQK